MDNSMATIPLQPDTLATSSGNEEAIQSYYEPTGAHLAKYYDDSTEDAE